MRRALLGMLLLPACMTPFQMSPSSVPLDAGRSYHVYEEHTGEACWQVILILPIEWDASLHTAKARLIDKVQGSVDGLIDITADIRSIYVPPFYYSRCVIMRAKPFGYLEASTSAEAEAVTGTPARQDAAPVRTAPSKPAPTPESVQRLLREPGMQRLLDVCWSRAPEPASLSATLLIDEQGKVRRADVAATNAKLKSCVETVLRRLELSPFDGASVSITVDIARAQ